MVIHSLHFSCIWTFRIAFLSPLSTMNWMANMKLILIVSYLIWQGHISLKSIVLWWWLFFSIIENNFKKYSAEKACGMFLRTHYLFLSFSVYLQIFICIYIFFFYSLIFLSFPVWELRGSPSSSLSFWLWRHFCQISHHFSLNWIKKFGFVCSRVAPPCPPMLGPRF